MSDGGTDVQDSTVEMRFRNAETLISQGRYREAFVAYTALCGDRLRRAASADGLAAADMVLCERLAGLAVLFGEHEAADDLFAACARLAGNVGNAVLARYLMVTRVHAALSAARLDDVRQGIEELENAWLGPLAEVDITPHGLSAFDDSLDWRGCGVADRQILLARLHLALGMWLRTCGQYGAATAVFDHGQRLCRGDGPAEAREALLLFRLQLAGTRIEYGDLAGGSDLLAGLAGAFDTAHRIGPRVEWLVQSSKLAALRGDLGQAVRLGEAIVAACRDGGFDRALAGAQLNLAHVLILINHTRVATDLLESGRALLDQLGDAGLTGRSVMLRMLARARASSMAEGVPLTSPVIDQQRRRRRAEPARRSEREDEPPDLPQASEFLDFFNDRAVAFQWHLGRRNLAGARRSLEALHAVFAHTDSGLIAARLRGLSGMLAYYEGSYDRARGELQAARGGLEQAGCRPEVWQLLRFLGWCLTRMARPQEEIQVVANDAASLLDGLVASLSGADRAVFLLNKWSADEEALAADVDALVALHRRAEGAMWLLRPFLRRRVRKGVLRLLDHVEHFREVMAMEAAGRIDGFAVRLLTRGAGWWRGRAVMAFLVLPDRTVLVRLVGRRVDFSVVPLSRLALRDLVARWHANVRRLQPVATPVRDLGEPPALDGVLPGAPAEPHSAASEAAEALAAALHLPEAFAGLPDGTVSVTILPDDVLNGFPFAAVRWDGAWACERYALSVGFTTKAPRQSQATGSAALLVAVADGAPGIPALPNTLEEAAALVPRLKAIGWGSRVLTGSAADRGTLLSELPRSGLVHIACHGIFRPDAPGRSGLLLVPHAQRVEMLTMADLARLDLRGTEHVTLSSCWSADNFVLPGRRILSLPETLWRAGAHSVLGCLWPVDDSLAVAFMDRFYRHLQDQPRDQALRRTQMNCVNGDLGPAATAPFFWSGFTLYGAAGRLPRPAGHDPELRA